MHDRVPKVQQVRFEEVSPANEYAAFFDASIESLVAHIHLPVFEGYDDLDDLRFALLTLPSGETVTLGQYPRAPEPGTYLYVVAITPETPKIIVDSCQLLAIPKEEILWIHSDFQAEFDLLYKSHGNCPRQHEKPQIEKESSRRNLYEPIDCFRHALQIYTRQKFPEYWAMLQHNLGLAYYHRIQGNKRENLERSIDCFNNSLQVYTQQDFPEKWQISEQDLSEAMRSIDRFIARTNTSIEACAPSSAIGIQQ
jgi:hypothetical protein